MNTDGTGLPVDSLEVLRRRRSAKWRTYDADVLPLTVAEMDFALAGPVAEVLRRAVAASDTGYAHAVPELGRAIAAFAGRRWNWDLDPGCVTAVTDVGVGVVETLRALTRPGDAVVGCIHAATMICGLLSMHFDTPRACTTSPHRPLPRSRCST